MVGLLLAGGLTVAPAGAAQVVEADSQVGQPPIAQEGSGLLADSALEALVDSLAALNALPDSPQAPARGAPEEQMLPSEADADGDGVPALSDFCPNSLPGQVVDETGCEASGRPLWQWAAGGAGALLLSIVLWMPLAAIGRLRRESRELRSLKQADAVAPAGFGAASGRPGHLPWAADPGHGPWAVPPTAAGGRAVPNPPAGPPASVAGATDAPVEDGLASGLPALQPDDFPEAPGQPAPVADSTSAPTSEPASGPPPGTVAIPTPLGVGYPAARTHRVDEDPETPGSTPPVDADPAAADTALGHEGGESIPRDTPAAKVPGGVARWKEDPLVYGAAGLERFGIVGRHPILSLAVVLAIGLGSAWWARGRPGFGPEQGIGGPATVQTAPVVVALTPDPTEAAPIDGPMPSQIRMIAGDGQRGRVGQTLVQALEIRVEDSDGNPVADLPVFWEATVGGGRLSPAAIQTDSTGIARSLWTLGPAVLTQYAVAKVAGFEESGVAFEAVAEPGLAARLTVLRGGGLSGPPGAMLDQPVVVRVEGPNGQPLEGIQVAFVPDGDGSVSESEAVSDTAGEARTAWTLGIRGDSARLTVQVVDAPGLVVELAAGIAYPRLPVVTGLVAGGTHTCQLTGSGVLACWGGNQNGQLGTGGGARATAPTRVDPGARYSAVSAGLSHTCAIEQRGEAYCWGDNVHGQLGVGSRSAISTPAKVQSEARFRRISAGTGHTCGVTRGSAILCWGSNVNGQLGDGTITDRVTPTSVSVSGAYDAVSVGWFHTCALVQDGRAMCWGRNAFGQVGDDSNVDRSRPTQAAGPMRFRRISAGGAHTCGLGSDGRVYCWGQNNFGQIGDATTRPRARPVAVATGGPWSAVAVGGFHSCALTMDGEAFCWGRNTYGQLGDGTTEDQSTPTSVVGDLRFATIYASGAHTCGRTTSGQGFCWGYNVEGQLGDGTRENRLTPTLVGGS